jgi:predicted Zn-dependent protease
MKIYRFEEFNNEGINEGINEENIPHVKSLAKNFLASGKLPDISNEKELSLYKQSLIDDIKEIFQNDLSQYKVNSISDEIIFKLKNEDHKIIISSEDSSIKLDDHKVYLTSLEARNLIKELERLYHESDEVIPLKGNIKKFSQN